MKKILIIEDDMVICNELVYLLSNAGYEAVVLSDFKNAKVEILSSCADLLLLDINIPYMNGELLLKEIRNESDVPVIIVTSRNSQSDEVLSISYGADDYITKPYNPTILLLRINNIFKRLHNYSDTFTYRDLKIDTKRGIISNDKCEVVLTKNEMIIFSYLVSSSDRIVMRDELMTALWNNNEYINDNALTVNISRLRLKLKDIGYSDMIETRKGQGYILK